MRCVSLSDRRFTIKGVFCEVARTESYLKGTMKEDGVSIHSLSGGVDLQLRESFDQLKVVVKRGEIDCTFCHQSRGFMRNLCSPGVRSCVV